MSALPRLTRRGLLLAGAGVSLVLIGAFSGFTDLVRAGIFALLLLVLSVLTLFVATRASAQVRHVGPRLPLEPGDRERVAVHAELSLSARFSGATLQEPHTFGGPTPSWPVEGRHFDGEYAVSAPHRGRFVTGPTRLVVRDPFGLAHLTRDVAARREIRVWPRQDVALTPQRERSLVGDSSIESHLAFGGEVGASVRQYVRGDDMRLVHWPATARRGELIVRQLDPPADETACARLVGHVETPGVDAGWEGLVEACASWLSARARAHQPFALRVGAETYRDLHDAMDALAVAGDCPLVDDAASAHVVFVHADTAGSLGPAPSGGEAFVAGSPDAVTSMRARLDADGWSTHTVPEARPVTTAPGEGAR